MSEIVCPSCEAKYRVPDNAIGPEGRRVHCSRCGEIWLARPVGRPGHHRGTETGPQKAIADGSTEAAAGPGAPAHAEPDTSMHAGPEAPRPAEPEESSVTEPQEPKAAAPEETEATKPEEPMAAGPEVSPAVAEEQSEPAEQGARPEERVEKTASREADEDGRGDDVPTAAEETAARNGAEDEPSWKRVFAAELNASARREGDAGEAATAPKTSLFGAPVAPAEEGGEESSDDAASPARPGQAAPAATPSAREEQMAEIRRMLDELQGPRAGAAAMPAAAAQSMPPAAPAGAAAAAGTAVAAGASAPPPRRPAPAEVEEIYHDPLREKLLQHDARKSEAHHQTYDRGRLMKKHARRTRRRMIAEEQRNSSGAFLTGFTLTALVAGSMMLIYAFAGEIAARVPGSEPAMQEYVAMIDEWRGAAAEQYAALRTKIEKLIEESI